MQKQKIIETYVSIGSFAETIDLITANAVNNRSSCVCVCNVHMVIESFFDNEFAPHVNNADLVTPDGKPLAISLKLLYGINQERVSGMDLMPALIKKSAENGISIFLYGTTEEILQKVLIRAKAENPSVKIVGHYSPPFRDLTEGEAVEVGKKINETGAQIVLVALGCPKQEKWMAQNKDTINAVMVGLGGAFPVYAGIQSRAPLWMQKYSLEWLYRLCQEPRRLFWRYFVTNCLFVFLISKELIKVRLLRKGMK